MAIAKYVKAAGDRKRYQIDYTDWLDIGESVVSVVFTIVQVTVPPLVIDTIAVLPTGLGVQYYASGGIDGQTYTVYANLTTSSAPAQTKLDDILFTVREPT